MDNRALDRWNKLVDERLLTPLGMSETSLVVPLTVHNVALGYQLPVFEADLSQTGTISDVVVETEAGPYSSQPSVTVTGGGGNGAVFKTIINQAGFITKLCMVSGGSGYVAPPVVGFSSPSEASGFKAIVKALNDNGQVTGVTFANVGAGYSDAIYPVTFKGGQAKGGRPATGYGLTVNGGFAYVLITDGGSGYYDPLKVVVQPPEGGMNVVPIWAPAGSLTSTLSDMARFATAALGSSEPSPALARISRAFKLAEQPRVCDSTNYHSPASCADGGPTNGLAWAITPASVPNGLPVTYKDGGITGFSTQVDLLPSKGIGVVTFANDFPQSDFDGVEDAPSFSAYRLGREMLNAVQLISP